MVTNSDIKYVRDLGSAINTNGGDDVHIIGNGLNFNPASIENIDEFNAENDKPIFKMSRGGEIFHNYEENGNFPWRESARRIFEDPYFFSSETMWRPTTLRDRNNPISNPNRSRIDVDLEHASEEEVSEWALELVAQISNNLVYGGIHLANFNKLSDRSKLDLYRLINMYNDPEGKTGVANIYYENEDGSIDVAWDGIGRAFKGIMSDPTTYGGGLIYKIGAKALAGLTGKLTSKGATLKAMQVLLSPTMLASVEGGIYSSAFDYQQQKFEIEGRNLNPLQYPDGRIPNEVQRNLDPTRLGTAYLMGAVLGPALEGAVKLTPLAYNKLNDIYKNIKKSDGGDGGGGSVDIDNPDNLSTREKIELELSELEQQHAEGLIDDFAFRDKRTRLIFDKMDAPITLYHGSPHEFDQFDISKIGSGEGHQAYGHGLYFAEAEAVSEVYKGYLGKRLEIDGVETIKDGRRTDLSDSLDGDEAQKYRTWSDMLKHYDPEEMPELTLQEVVLDSYDDKLKRNHQMGNDKTLEIERFHKYYKNRVKLADIKKDIIQRTIDHIESTGKDVFNWLEDLPLNKRGGTSYRVPDDIKYGDLSPEEFFDKHNITGDNRLAWLGLTYRSLLEDSGWGVDATNPKNRISISTSDSLRNFKDNPDLLNERTAELKDEYLNEFDMKREFEEDKISELKEESKILKKQTDELINLIDEGKVTLENTGKMYKSDVDIKKHQTIDFDDFVYDEDLKNSLVQTMFDLFHKDGPDGLENEIVDALEAEIRSKDLDEDLLENILFDYNYANWDQTFEDQFERFLKIGVFDFLTGEEILRVMRDTLQDAKMPWAERDKAVEILRKALVKNDIKGLKFDDQMSRGSMDKGTHNYVIYDDRIIDIVKRYAVPVPIAGYMLSQLDGQSDQQEQIY